MDRLIALLREIGVVISKTAKTSVLAAKAQLLSIRPI